MAEPDRDDPLAVFRILARAKVPFVIIGGHAVNFHGYVRTTEDADLVFTRTRETESNLLRALESIHAKWISEERDPVTKFEIQIPVSAAYVRGTRLMMLTTDVGFLDIYDYVPGFPDVPVQELSEGSVTVEGLRFVSLQWLRRLKKQAGRHRDMDDLEHLPEPRYGSGSARSQVRESRSAYGVCTTRPLRRVKGRKR